MTIPPTATITPTIIAVVSVPPLVIELSKLLKLFARLELFELKTGGDMHCMDTELAGM